MRSACRRRRGSSSTRPPSQLTLPQAALLAGLPQAPTQYNPFNDPSGARARRNEVLAKMAQLGYITLAQQAYADAAPLDVHHGAYYSTRTENFFFNYVQQQLIAKYGANTVLQGGLKVYTTLNLSLQHAAQKTMATVLNQPGDPSAAIVTENPRNGQVLAMAQSSTYQQTQYNLATEGHRQPGSTFKAIDLATALSDGIDPNNTDYDSHFLAAGWLPGYPTYSVQTFGGEQQGSINLVQATVTSDNTVYAQLAADLGEKNITNMAYRLGVTTKLDSYPAEALGGLTNGVTPLEMANVYSTLADGGYSNTQTVIRKVVFPDGTVDSSWSDDNRSQAVSDGVAAQETNILEQNVLRGTATASAVNCPTAAKTGTTTKLVDAWLDGYTPGLRDGRLDGLPERRRPDDQRSRPAPAGRGAAGADVARLHAAGHRHTLHAVPDTEAAAGLQAVHRAAEPCHQRRRRKRQLGELHEHVAVAVVGYTDDDDPGEEEDDADLRPDDACVPATFEHDHGGRRRQQRGWSGRPGDADAADEPPGPERRREPRGRRGRWWRRRRADALTHRRAATATPGRDEPGGPDCYGGRTGGPPGRPRAAHRRGVCEDPNVAKEDKVEFEGEVIEALPNAMFRVKLDNEHVVLGHVAGKMRRFRIRILPGDRVRCELSPYDLDRARIVYRHR